MAATIPHDPGCRMLEPGGGADALKARRHRYGSHDELRAHLALFLDACNHARRLKAIHGLTPYEIICRTRTGEPERFRLNPLHHTPGLNI